MAERAATISAEAAAHPGQAPSIFEVLAKDSLTSGLRPALKHLLKYFAASRPEQLGPFLKWYDEIYTGLEAILENYYLKNYSGSFSENFYGMKRVSFSGGYLNGKERIRSLLFLVFVPYIKRKLDNLYETLKIRYANPPANPETISLKEKLIRAFLTAYPMVNTGIEVSTFILQLGYILSKTAVHSPWLLLSGSRLEKLTPADLAKLHPSLPSLAKDAGFMMQFVHFLKWLSRGFLVVLSKSLGISLFFLQFLDWWFTNDKAPDPRSLNRLATPSHPRKLLKESQVLKLEPSLCPICRKKRHNDTILSVSGYVFCYACIFHYLNQHHRCPVTKLPAESDQLIRIFSQPA